jgi:hypothetical protein
LHCVDCFKKPSGPLNPFRRVGLVLLRDNDVPAKSGRFPRWDAIDKQVPKVRLGNSVKLPFPIGGLSSTGKFDGLAEAGNVYLAVALSRVPTITRLPVAALKTA